ncbi:Doublecortin domain-containing protein 1 [Vulpes lagopus]
MEVSQQSNAEGTFNGDTIHPIYKCISKDLPRVAEFSSLKFQPAQNWHRLSQRQKLHPRVITVTAYKNGSRTVCAKVTVPTITLLLEECTEKLNLNMAARRVFLADGTEALKPEDIPHEADVYVSTGEPFLDPFKKIKDHLLLMKKVTWTMNGLMLPTDVKRQKTKPVLSVRMKKLSEKTSVRILFFKNGMGQDGHEITVGKETIKKVLDTCTMKMKLNLPARYLYDLYGRKIKDISKVCASKD